MGHHIPEDETHLGMILHKDENWLVVNKPEGLATHAGSPGELGVVEWLELHHGFKTHVVSRLDRGTSGILLLARTPEASARAQRIHEQGESVKTYEFLSTAVSKEERWTCDTPLDDKSAHTEFSRQETLGTLATPNGPLTLTRYEARITRGRKHQIRRHAQAGGVPVFGDRQYGTYWHGRLCLHCRTLQWPGVDNLLVSPSPHSFEALAAGDHSSAGLGLAMCRDRRLDWLRGVTDAFRAVHRDEIQGLPAAIDVYGGFFDAVWFDETADPEKAAGRLDPVLAEVCKIHGCRGGIVRTHRRNPHQRSLVTETRVFGKAPPDRFTVQEHGLKYEINLTQTQHTGLFLDQRDTRRRMFLQAEGKRLANLFAYTCSFSVVAIAGGGEVAFSVDVAKPGLNTGKTNFEWNDLAESGKGKFIQEDVRRWLERQLRRRDEDAGKWQPMDLVVCDPPVFASSKQGGKFSVEKEWPRLAEAAAQLMPAGGQALFANNHRAGDHAFYRRELESRFSTVQDIRPPLDFPVAEGRPHHVRIFWCEK
jgi:23S rRNA G2069 N7-methylase RlmK/C1962 C5-methylase RlmI